MIEALGDEFVYSGGERTSLLFDAEKVFLPVPGLVAPLVHLAP